MCKKSSKKIPKHAEVRIKKHNLKAVRNHERIDIHARKPAKVTRGWLPHAIAMNCWSCPKIPKISESRAAWRMRQHRGIKRRRRATASDPGVRSVTAVAHDAEASTTYVQRLRDAVAQVACEMQRNFLDRLPDAPGQAAVLEVSFDETEVLVSLPTHLRLAKRVMFTQTEVPVFTSHGTLDWPGAPTDIIPIASPAHGLSGKTPGDMLECLTKS